MVKVCDAIMGTGKSSAAITYMNEHPEKKFIYITPYLDEAKRITRSCPDMHFWEPKKKSEFHGSKVLHCAELAREGKNIATTHQAIFFYQKELAKYVREEGYTLIIDESMEVLKEVKTNPYDVQLVIDAGYIEKSNYGEYVLVGKEYNGNAFEKLLRILTTNSIIEIDNRSFVWQFSIELFFAAQDVFVLTYLFDGQDLRYFLDMNHIPYEYVSVARDQDGTFRFTDGAGYIPEYVWTIKDMIHILDNDRMNKIGDRKRDLSMGWFARNKDGAEQLKKNIYNYFNNILDGTTSKERMWTTYVNSKHMLQGLGYTKGFVPFNQRAVNDLKHKTALAYCVNLHMNVSRKNFYKANDVSVSDEDYALSNMVQWIWRSAIRDGKPVDLYIPSRRMRNLLIDWMDNVSKGGVQKNVLL